MPQRLSHAGFQARQLFMKHFALFRGVFSPPREEVRRFRLFKFQVLVHLLKPCNGKFFGPQHSPVPYHSRVSISSRPEPNSHKRASIGPFSIPARPTNQPDLILLSSITLPIVSDAAYRRSKLFDSCQAFGNSCHTKCLP